MDGDLLEFRGAGYGDDELLANFQRWLLVLGESGAVSDRALARALGVPHNGIGRARTAQSLRASNPIRRVCYALGDELWSLDAGAVLAWSDAVASGERESAFAMAEALEVAIAARESAAGSGADAGVVDASAASEGIAGVDAVSGGIADTGDTDAVCEGAESAGDLVADADDCAESGMDAESVVGVDAGDFADMGEGDAALEGDAGMIADAGSAGFAIAEGAGVDGGGGELAVDAVGGLDAADMVGADDASADALGGSDGGLDALAADSDAGIAGASADREGEESLGDDAGGEGEGALGDAGVDGAGAVSDGAGAGVGGDQAGAPESADADSGGVMGVSAAPVSGARRVGGEAMGDASSGANEDGGLAVAETGGGGSPSSGVSAAVGEASTVSAARSPRRKRGGIGGLFRKRGRGVSGISAAGGIRSVEMSGVSAAGEAGSDGDAVSGDAVGEGADAGVGVSAMDDAVVGDGKMGGVSAAGGGGAGIGGGDLGAGESAGDGAGADDAAVSDGAGAPVVGDKGATADSGGAGDAMGVGVSGGEFGSAGFDGAGVNPDILGIRRRMSQWTKKADGEAARAEWEAREDPGGEIAALRRVVGESESIEEIAYCCDGPVLLEIPGLTLEDARASALMKIDGWTPTGGGASPPGLYGDAPLLFHLGVECSYADEGARAVAFAPNLAYEEETGYTAVRLRYGLTPYDRMARYMSEDYLERPKRVGFFRHANRLPARPYPDSDWFFGSSGLPRPGGVWMPSIAEASAFYYMVKDVLAAFRGTAGDDSAYAAYLRLLILECEYLFFDPDYWMTMHYHRAGKMIGGSTRVFERQTLFKQIAAADVELARFRRRRLMRRLARGALRVGSWPVRALWRRFFAGAPAAMPDDMAGAYTGSADWEPLAAGWLGRDRTRWYETGVGCLSDHGDGWLSQLPDAMAEAWGGVARPRRRSVPGPGERLYKHGKWRAPRKLS